MHELGIAAAALRQTLEHARENKAARVTRIVLRVGELSGVDPDSLRFALASILPGTAAAGAEIEIKAVRGMATCSRCGRSYSTRERLIPPCPGCGGSAGRVARGRELDLVRLEVE